MNNYKTHVRIGRKYREAFKSICDLVKSGCIDTSIIESCKEDRWIETAQYIFEYTGDPNAIDTGKQVGMTPSGASWFTGFRGGDQDSVMGTWHNLIEIVATNYHKEFSLVEYVQNTLNRNPEEFEQYKSIIKNVANSLKLPFTKIAEASMEDSQEDIYEVSLRMELFGGAGEPRPILCKIYFRNQNGNLLLLPTSEAAIVDEYIRTIVERRRSTPIQDNGGATEIVDYVLNSVSKLVEGDKDYNFAESLLITNPIDKTAINELLNAEPQDEVYLQCKRLKVLGISHVSWMDAAFSVYMGDKKTFLIKIGLNNAVNLFCCCGDKDSKLIENNLIKCVSKESGAVEYIQIFPEEEGIGLDEKMLEQIREESAFSRHFFPISCSELRRRGVECSRYRCECNTYAFTVGDKVRRKCADCPYPEVVYRYGDGNVAYTPQLSYDMQTMSVVTDAELSTCRICGRNYVSGKAASVGGLCDFCNNAMQKLENKTVGKTERKIYRRYAKMLPVSVRMKCSNRKKYCFENLDRLLFVVGKNKYFFDKLNITDNGRISKPRKRQ